MWMHLRPFASLFEEAFSIFSFLHITALRVYLRCFQTCIARSSYHSALMGYWSGLHVRDQEDPASAWSLYQIRLPMHCASCPSDILPFLSDEDIGSHWMCLLPERFQTSRWSSHCHEYLYIRYSFSYNSETDIHNRCRACRKQILTHISISNRR